MLTRPYKFAFQGIHVVEFVPGDTPPPEVIAQARKDGAWVDDEEPPAEKREAPAIEPETPAEPPAAARETKPAGKGKGRK